MLEQNIITSTLRLTYKYEKDLLYTYKIPVECSIKHAQKSEDYCVIREENNGEISWFGLYTNWKYNPEFGWQVLFKNEFISSGKPFYEDLYYAFSSGRYLNEASLLQYYFSNNELEFPFPKGTVYYLDYDYGQMNNNATSFEPVTSLKEKYDYYLDYVYGQMNNNATSFQPISLKEKYEELPIFTDLMRFISIYLIVHEKLSVKEIKDKVDKEYGFIDWSYFKETMKKLYFIGVIDNNPLTSIIKVKTSFKSKADFTSYIQNLYN